jgi:hypothetical protein
VQRAPVEVPIDVGIGPTLLVPNPPLLLSQPAYAGVSLSIAAVIDQELIRKNAGRIPSGLRRAASSLNEVRYRPWFLGLVPELLVISPQVDGLSQTGMYGAVWRPFGLGVSLLDEPVHLSANAAVDLAYLFIHSSAYGGGSSSSDSITHFVRPGINAEIVLEIPVTDTLLFSTGWSSDVFIPQPLGAPPWDVAPLDEALWHLGGPFVKLHVRIPYTVSL